MANLSRRTLLTAGLAGATVTRIASASSLLLATQLPVRPAHAASSANPLTGPGDLLVVPVVRLLDGSERPQGYYDDQVVVLYWWASWCPFCALQSPEIDRLWRTNRDRGLQVLGLSIDKQPETAAAHLKQKAYEFPSTWVDDELARRLPKPKGLPVTVVRGRDGRVLQAESGQLFPEDVEQMANWLKA